MFPFGSTDGVYYADLVFGREAPESLKPPFDVGEKIAHHLRGHWKDRIGRTYLFSAAYDGPELSVIRFNPEKLQQAQREILS